MALPTVTINKSTGSNTAASGAGPATAVTGAGASTNNTTTVDVSADAPDLSGIATDGSAVLYVNTSTGMKFSKITATDNTAKTITTEGTWGQTESGRAWAVGGKRKDFETTNANTKQLFADAKPGWIIDIEEAGSSYVLTSAITVSAAGSAAVGIITIKSSSATRPTITSATNSVTIWNITTTGMLLFDHLHITHTAGTRGAAFSAATTTAWGVRIRDTIIDGCSAGVSCSNRMSVIVEDCEIKNCVGAGVDTGQPANPVFILGCHIHDNGGSGFGCSGGSFGRHTCIGTIFSDNASGISFGSTGVIDDLVVDGCTFANNTGDGIQTLSAHASCQISVQNSIFYGNGGHGVDLGGAAEAAIAAVQWFNRNNAYGSNTSGARNNFPAGVDDVTLTADPFTDAANGDFSLNNTAGGGAACRAAGFPGVFPGGLTTGFLDIGAVQHEDSGGGGGGITVPIGGTMRGGF